MTCSLFCRETAEGRYVPNAGFLEDVVLEDPAFASSEASGSYETAADASNDEQRAVEDADLGDSVDTRDAAVDDNASMPQSGSKSGSVELVADDVADLKITYDATTSNETIVEEQHAFSSPADVDACLDKCLLQALHTTVKDKDLPMPGSTLWSNHVIPCRPSGITLDIKKSSHKKLSKWLQAKASAGLISVKEDKYKKETVLLSVNCSHPDYVAFKPEKKQEQKIVQSCNQASSESRSQKVLEVGEIYKPSVHVNPIFSSVGADTSRLYTASEATEVVFQYIEKENLVKPMDKAVVVLNPALCDTLFKGAIKKGSTYPTEIHKKDLGATFIGRMQAHHIVTRGSESVVRKGALKPIQIVTERRQGNKKVTKVSGVETFLMDAEALASELQKKFACSTTVAELPGKKGLEVLIQGGVIEDVARHLMDQYGVPKRFIEVLDKTRK